MAVARFLARAALVAALPVALAFPAPALAQSTLRVVMHSDLKIVDPIWTTAYITRNHGYMIYDTLFATDANGRIQPQMADRYTVSPDGLVYTITLRDGLAVARRCAGHRRGLRRVDQALGREGRDRAEDDDLRQGLRRSSTRRPSASTSPRRPAWCSGAWASRRRPRRS